MDGIPSSGVEQHR